MLTEEMIEHAKQLIICYVVNKLSEKFEKDENEILNNFMLSETYRLLEDSETHLYCRDCHNILDMYECELNNDYNNFDRILAY